MTKLYINEIEKALRLNINYTGVSSNGVYTRIMDRLAYDYKGAKSQSVVALLDEYFEEVGVSSLKEAFNRLRKLEGK